MSSRPTDSELMHNTMWRMGGSSSFHIYPRVHAILSILQTARGSTCADETAIRSRLVERSYTNEQAADAYDSDNTFQFLNEVQS